MIVFNNFFLLSGHKRKKYYYLYCVKNYTSQTKGCLSEERESFEAHGTLISCVALADFLDRSPV